MKKYNEFRPLIKGGRNLVDERELGILRLRGVILTILNVLNDINIILQSPSCLR